MNFCDILDMIGCRQVAQWLNIFASLVFVAFNNI